MTEINLFTLDVQFIINFAVGDILVLTYLFAQACSQYKKE